jgi:hypothetical protein
MIRGKQMPQKQNQKTNTGEPGAGKQTDLAEGELETVEESIRIHEQKGDLESPEDRNRRKEENTDA